MGIKANKTRGHKAEIEVDDYINQHYPDEFYMVRTGLDGGHDHTGRRAVGETKAVMAGPKWLQEMIDQLGAGGADEEHMHKLGFVRLTRNGRVRWFNVIERDAFTALIKRAAQVPPSPLERGSASDEVQPAG